MRDLARAVSRAPEGLELVWGIVRAAHTGPNSIDVSINGSPAGAAVKGVAYDSLYTPTVGDTVAVLRQPSRQGCDHFVLGKRA